MAVDALMVTAYSSAIPEGTYSVEISPIWEFQASLPGVIRAQGAESNGIGGTGGAPPHNKAGHTWHHPDAQLREWVLNGKLGFGSPGMPALGDKLAEPEVDAILTFIKTWWTAGQRESQADISRRYQDALDKQPKR